MSPEDDSPIPVNTRFMKHLRDPLFAAAVGQPSRFNVTDAPELEEDGEGSNDLSTSLIPRLGDPIDLGLITELEARRLFNS